MLSALSLAKQGFFLYDTQASKVGLVMEQVYFQH